MKLDGLEPRFIEPYCVEMARPTVCDVTGYGMSDPGGRTFMDLVYTFNLCFDWVDRWAAPDTFSNQMEILSKVP